MNNLKFKMQLLVVLLAGSLSLYGYDFVDNGIAYTITSFSKFECSVMSKEEPYRGSITIPASVTYSGKVLSVVSVADSAFFNNSELNEVVIPNTVLTIGSSSFCGCSSLKTIGLNEGLEEIGSLAFKGCINVNNIAIPSTTKRIGDKSFEDCKSIKGIIIPHQIKTIQSNTFQGCSALESISLKSVTEIGANAFKDCQSLDSVEFGNSLMSIGDYAFENCGFSKFIIPNSVTKIGDYILNNTLNLKSLTLGAGISSLTSNPCSGCNEIEELIIADGSHPLEIAFSGDEVESYRWMRYSYLQTTDPFEDISFCKSGLTLIPFKTLYVGRNLISKSDAIFEIGISASKYLLPPLYNHPTLSVLTIGENVTVMPETKWDLELEGYKTFIYNNSWGYLQDCIFLNEINLSQNLTSISDKMFKGSNIRQIYLPSSIKEIGSEAFSNCGKLQSILIGKNCKKIGTNAFYENESLKEICLCCLIPPQYHSEFSNMEYINVILNIPPQTLEVYKNATPWNNFWNIQESNKCLSEFTIDDITYEVIDSNKVEVVEINAKGDVIVPTSIVYEDCPFDVVSMAVKVGDEVTSLSIGAACQQIKKFSFTSNSKLKNITIEEAANPLLISGCGDLCLSSSVTPYPNASTVDEKRTAYRNGYYNGLFYGLPIENLEINRNISLKKYYERTNGASIGSYSKVYNDIVYYPPFYGLKNLKNVEIGKNVTSLCKNEIKVFINAVQTDMIYTNFGQCDNIEIVVSKNSNAPIGGGFSQSVYENASLYLPNGGIDSYKTDEYWSKFVNIVESIFIPIESVKFEHESIELPVGEAIQLTPLVTPENASYSSVIWSSSNPEVAKVSETGMVRAISDGSALVTATFGKIIASCKIMVHGVSEVENLLANPNSRLSVYSIDGMLISKGCSPQELKSFDKGLYIVVSGQGRYKISIK